MSANFEDDQMPPQEADDTSPVPQDSTGESLSDIPEERDPNSDDGIVY